MKTVIISLFCGCMLFANQVFAQKQKSKLLPIVTITAGDNVSKNVHEAFMSRFKNAENLKWFEVNQNYLVKFIMEDQLHHASFKKNGDLIYHISYGEEKNLPSTVLTEVKSKYDKYDIGKVFNVETNGRNVWIVNLESKKYIIVASIENNGVNNGVNEISRIRNATATPYDAEVTKSDLN